MYTSRTLEPFGWRAKEPLGAVSLRNNAIEAHFQVDFLVVLASLADVFAQLDSSTVRRQQEQTSWRPSEIVYAADMELY